mgnify:FL=1
MDSKATIYAERTALTDVLRKAFTKAGLDNIIEIFKNHSNICMDLTNAELNSIFNPSDSDNSDDLFTIFKAYDISVPIALKDFFDLMNAQEDAIISKPNAFFLRDCPSEDAQMLRDKYGVWVISKEEVTNRMFESLSFKDEFVPGTKYGKDDNGWKNIINDNGLQLPPSNSLIVSDNFLLSNERNGDIIGLANLTHLLDAILPQKLSIPYYILVLGQGKDDKEAILIRRVTEWKDGLAAALNRNYDIHVEFVFSNNLIHRRILYMNYSFIGTEKGFKIFEPLSNRVYRDGDQRNSAWAYTYFHDPFRAGRREHQLANDDIECVKAIYKTARSNYDNGLKIVGIPKFVGAPLGTTSSPNRVLD